MDIANTEDEHSKQEELAASPEVRLATRIALRGSRVMRRGGHDGCMALVVLGVDGRYRAFGCAVIGDEKPSAMARRMLTSMTLYYRARAFACVTEAWVTLHQGLSPDAAEGMRRMVEDGRLPPPSQNPARQAMFWITRGDHTRTQVGYAPIDGDTFTWHRERCDAPGLIFTLEGFDEATLAKVAKSNAGEFSGGMEGLRELARRHLRHMWGTAFDAIDAGLNVGADGKVGPAPTKGEVS